MVWIPDRGGTGTSGHEESEGVGVVTREKSQYLDRAEFRKQKGPIHPDTPYVILPNPQRLLDLLVSN